MRRKNQMCLIIIVIIISFMGCATKYKDKTIEEPKLGSISLYTYNNDSYKLYNLDGEKIFEVDSLGRNVYGKYNEIIIYTKKDEEAKVYYSKGGKEKELPSFNGELVANSDKTKVLYKRAADDDSMELLYFDFLEEREYKVNTDILFSGNNFAWYDNQHIIIYGIKNISEEKKENGIFDYNIKDSSQKKIVDIDEGFVEYLKVNNKDIYYLLSTEKESVLNRYNIESNKKSNIISGFNVIEDIEVREKDIYILGRLENQSTRIYKYNDEKMQQLTYDFPKNIDSNNDIVVDKEGNVIFIGYDELSLEKDIYLKVKDSNTIKLISDKSGNYNFIRN